MKVYDVKEVGYCSQVHSVVAPNIAIAEKVYLSKYKFASIYSITLHSDYVEIAPQENIEAANTASNTASTQAAKQSASVHC